MLQIGFAGRLSVVTGGASGIGRATAGLLARCGSRVVALDRDTGGLEALRSSGIEGREVDVAVGKQVSAAFDSIVEEFGPIDVLVNAAGVTQRPLRPETAPEKEVDRVVAVNFKGTYLCCIAAGSAMAARGSGVIVNVASILGLLSSPLHAYGPTKAAVINLTAGLAAEWGRSGVRVNAIVPGFTATPALALAIGTHYVEKAGLTDASAQGRLVTADEVAAAIVFLASDLASAITGVALPVDCGAMAVGTWPAYGGLRPARENQNAPE